MDKDINVMLNEANGTFQRDVRFTHYLVEEAPNQFKKSSCVLWLISLFSNQQPVMTSAPQTDIARSSKSDNFLLVAGPPPVHIKSKRSDVFFLLWSTVQPRIIQH